MQTQGNRLKVVEVRCSEKCSRKKPSKKRAGTNSGFLCCNKSLLLDRYDFGTLFLIVLLDAAHGFAEVCSGGQINVEKLG
jgi:hypothetical protein